MVERSCMVQIGTWKIFYKIILASLIIIHQHHSIISLFIVLENFMYLLIIQSVSSSLQIMMVQLKLTNNKPSDFSPSLKHHSRCTVCLLVPSHLLHADAAARNRHLFCHRYCCKHRHQLSTELQLPP